MKTIKIFSTIGIGEVSQDSPEQDMCPIYSWFSNSGTDVVPETCTKCLTNDHVGEENAWELNVTRTSFENGLQEEMFIRIETYSNLFDWQDSKHEVTVHILKFKATCFNFTLLNCI